MAVDCGRDVNVVEARLANAAAGFHRAAACDTPGGSMVIFRSHGRNPMAVGCGYGKPNSAVGIFGDLYY